MAAVSVLGTAIRPGGYHILSFESWEEKQSDNFVAGMRINPRIYVSASSQGFGLK